MDIKIDIYGGQYTLVKVNTGLSTVNKISYRDLNGDWVPVRDWSRDQWCLVKLPCNVGKYTIVAWVAITPTDEMNDILIVGGEVNLTLPDLLCEQADYWAYSKWINVPFEIAKQNANCFMIQSDIGLAFACIVKEMFFEPTKASRKIFIGDMSSYGGCPGHPSGSHSNGKDVDICYYTMGDDNMTENLGVQYPHKIFTGDSIDPDKFDIDRNRKLFSRLKSVFPECAIRVDERIARHVLSGSPENYNLILDPPYQWSHNTHMHVSFGDKINWSALLD